MEEGRYIHIHNNIFSMSITLIYVYLYALMCSSVSVY
ncbi:unnamed protein product [Brassica oleracea]|uniref:(rape) hypothetical protein n=1 Tax=Brassica napus TaxID=3708 RepID=A0A816Q5B4_BRANA|nr:unnamed protein product [Brassica napus]